MRGTRYIVLLLTSFAAQCFAIDLTSGYKQAEDLVKNSKPQSSEHGDRVRNEREERSSEPREQQNSGPSAVEQRTQRKKDEERRKKDDEEKKKRRVQGNLETIEKAMIEAAAKLRAAPPALISGGDSPATIAGRQRAIDALMKSNNQLPAHRAASTGKAEALRNAELIRLYTARGQKPPFAPLWNYYKYNRPLALGLVPKTNRCAIVLSLALGVEPRQGETSLHDLGNKELVKTLVGPLKSLLDKPVQNSEVAKTIYIQARQLANRLKNDWGNPMYYEGKNALDKIKDKKGIIYLYGASLAVRRDGDHIDVWDHGRLGADGSVKPEDAIEVWFWEIP